MNTVTKTLVEPGERQRARVETSAAGRPIPAEVRGWVEPALRGSRLAVTSSPRLDRRAPAEIGVRR